MDPQQGHSKACCNVPPAIPKDYKQKGHYITLTLNPNPNTTGATNTMQCYATGPTTATTALLLIYDIFGFSPQALQGADILAHADGPTHQYRVFMPDFFLGKPLPHSDFPPDTEEKKKKVGQFFAGPANPGETAEKVPGLLRAIEKQQQQQQGREHGIEKWGSLGMCWGGKIVALTAQPGTPFTAAAAVHPAMVDPSDAKGIKIPLCMLASRDEDANAVKKFGDALSGPKHIETFGDQVHGWMAARGDLEDERVRGEYERGYQVLLDFYHRYL